MRDCTLRYALLEYHARVLPTLLHMQECTYRRIVEDDGKGRRKLEIGHRALAKFLFLSVSFVSCLSSRGSLMPLVLGSRRSYLGGFNAACAGQGIRGSGTGYGVFKTRCKLRGNSDRV